VILKRGLVVLTPLPAPLLEEALYSGAARVLRIPAPVGDLELLELNYGGDIGINSASRK
jgi:hypothetical protein